MILYTTSEKYLPSFKINHLDNNSIANLAEIDSFELPTAHFRKMEYNIIWIRYKIRKDEFTVEDAMAHSDAVSTLNGGKPAHLIIDFRESEISFSTEAREYFAKNPDHSKLRKSQALILKGLAQKIVANFYLKFHRPNCPVQYFTDAGSAFKWILNLGT